MNDKNRNLAVRIVSALVLGPIVIFLVYKGGYFAAGLFGVAALACAGEYYAMVYKRLTPAAVVGMVAAFCLPLGPAFFPDRFGQVAFWLVSGVFFFAWIYFLLRGPLGQAPTHAAHLITGMLYGGIGMSALAAVRVGVDGAWWVLAALIITWANDTLAYFFGRFLGKHKLYPEVSPNKTWEGFFGGMLGGVLGMFVFRAFFFTELTVVDCLVLGIVGGILGPLGDLAESMLKRAYNVKDSGRSIPGHGGFLDRIDALLFNSALVWAYLLLRGR